MDTTADFTDDSVRQFLTGVADLLDTCADRGTQGDWAVSQSPRTFIVSKGNDRAVVCGAVQKSNARLILAASPDGPRAAAGLLRSVASLPYDAAAAHVLESAFTLASHYNAQMKLKADSVLRSAQEAAS